MTKDEIIKALRDMAKYPTVTLPRDCEALRMAADLLAQPEQEQFALKHRIAELEGAVIGLQTQRTWVGLNDAEVENLCLSLGAEPIEVRFIEAKLKEKNT